MTGRESEVLRANDARSRVTSLVRLELSDLLLRRISEHAMTRGETQMLLAELAVQAARMTLVSERDE